MRTPFVLGLMVLCLLAGCTHIISEKSLDRADRSVSFDVLRKDPDAYKGKFVILGGSMGKTALDLNGVKALASLPSLDELRAKIVGLLVAPATKIAQLTNAPAAKVARVVQAYASKGAAA